MVRDTLQALFFSLCHSSSARESSFLFISQLGALVNTSLGWGFSTLVGFWWGFLSLFFFFFNWFIQICLFFFLPWAREGLSFPLIGNKALSCGTCVSWCRNTRQPPAHPFPMRAIFGIHDSKPHPHSPPLLTLHRAGSTHCNTTHHFRNHFAIVVFHTELSENKSDIKPVGNPTALMLFTFKAHHKGVWKLPTGTPLQCWALEEMLPGFHTAPYLLLLMYLN